MLTDAALNTQLAALPAPRITAEDIKARIRATTFTVVETLTICVITLDNGFMMTGESACADPSNFNREIGERLAYDAAFDKLWPFFGIMLRERQYAATELAPDAVWRGTFGEAVAALKRGRRVARNGWNGKNMYLQMARTSTALLVAPSPGSIPDPAKHVLPHILMFTADGQWVPWLASQTDMLASDWRTV